MQPFELMARDGLVLHGRHWPPAPACPVRGVVQLVHGMGEHGMRYAPLAVHLNAAGFAVAGHDNRAHGLTAGPDRLGLMPPDSGWGRWIEDILQVADYVAQRWPGQPHILLGHSLGSFMAQHVAALHSERFAAVVLSATDSRPGMGTELYRLLGRLLGRLHRPERRIALLYWLGVGRLRSSIPNRRTDADWLSRDAAMVDAYLADPLCNFLPSVAMWRAVTDGLSRVSGSLRGRLAADVPVLLLVGTADPLSVGGHRVRALAQAYRDNGASQVTLLEYPDARHEVFSETNRTEIMDDLVTWLVDVLIRRSAAPATRPALQAPG